MRLAGRAEVPTKNLPKGVIDKFVDDVFQFLRVQLLVEKRGKP